MESPLIRKFSNCVYFGHKCKDIHEGFLYYFEGKIYWGQFSNSIKNGQGAEINLENGSLFKG